MLIEGQTLLLLWRKTCLFTELNEFVASIKTTGSVCSSFYTIEKAWTAASHPDSRPVRTCNGMRTVPWLNSSPTDTSPRTIPRLTFPRRNNPRWTFPRTDNSPKETSQTGHFPTKTFPHKDISPNGHFPDRTFPWPHVLVRFFFSNHFLFVCTRIY